MGAQRHILVFGDSLTWGIIPGTRDRHLFADRWPQIVETDLAGAARITTEALPGRTSVWDDPFRTGRNGRSYFLPLLQSHTPVDLVVIMLGVNDLQIIYPAGAPEAAKGVGLIGEDALSFDGDGQDHPPDVLIVAPPLISKTYTGYSVMQEAGADSEKLAGELELVAQDLGCAFFDASRFTVPGKEDGIHLDRENTRKLGKALVAPITEALNDLTQWQEITDE